MQRLVEGERKTIWEEWDKRSNLLQHTGRQGVQNLRRSSCRTLQLALAELNFLVFMNQSLFFPLVTPVILLLRPDS